MEEGPIFSFITSSNEIVWKIDFRNKENSKKSVAKKSVVPKPPTIESQV